MMDYRKIKNILEILIVFILLAFFIFVGKNKLAAFYYNRGQGNYEANLYKEAIDDFNKSLRLSPAISTTHYSLANAYGADGQPEKAVEEYKKAIQLDPHFLWGYEALIDIYLQKKAYQEALVILKEAEASFPDKQEIKDLKNLVSFKQVDYFINNGVNAFSAGEKSKGYELLNKALQINPDFAVTYYALGHFYYIENKYEEALEMLHKALSLDSKFVLAHKLSGDIYFGKGAFDKAVDEYKAAIAINDRDPLLFNNLGLSFMNLEDYQESIKFLEKGVDLNPSNVNFRYNLASVYRDAGRTKDAVLGYMNVIKDQPDYPNVHNDLADIYKQSGQKDKALQEYQKEIDFGQIKLLEMRDDPILLSIVSYAYNGLGQYAKAKELIDRALAINPDCREVYLTYAGIQDNLGEHQNALASLERAKKLSSRRQIFIEQKVEDIKEELKAIARGAKSLPADSVYLKNGRHFEGIIMGETGDNITLKINLGNSTGSITLPKNDIERIVSKKQGVS